MKAKFTFLFLSVVLCGLSVNAQVKRPYNNLIITETRLNNTPQNYIEFTNKGDETIDLSQFEFGTIGPWTQPFTADANNHFMLPQVMLAPGASFVIAVGSDFEPENWLRDPLHYSERVTKPEMYQLADMILHRRENNSNAQDSITPRWNTMDTWNGRDCYYLRHHYLNDEGMRDSMLIDQVGGIFDEADGTSRDAAHDVAGVLNATNNSVLIRKNSITAGINEFSSTEANADAARVQFDNARGLDLNDSEWIPVPILGWNEPWRAVFWTVGNQGDYNLDENTLVSKTGRVTVDLDNSTITVPWGVRNDDSLMYQFERRPGLAWAYDYAPTVEDSAYISARTGDMLTLYVCGNDADIQEFTIEVLPPTEDDNIVIPKNGFDYTRMIYGQYIQPYSGYRVTDGVSGMDSITHIDYATRVDTLLKYLEKAPDATWEIVFQDGIERPDLKNGDMLRVTSQSGQEKDYFLKLEKFVPSADAYLASITWPDMPEFYRGDIAEAYGWKGDTIPGFLPSKNVYVVSIPIEYEGIPALVFHKQHLDSKVEVKRAVSLNGTPADRTITFTVTAENDTTINVYTVRFEKEKDPANVQTFIGEPFFSQYIFWESWSNAYLEIVNPGTEPLDLSNYMIAMGWGGPADVLLYDTGIDSWNNAYSRYVPGRKWQDQANWAVQPAILEPDMATNAIVFPGDVFVIADLRTFAFNDENHGNGDTEYRDEIDIDFSRNPWSRAVHDNTAIRCWHNATLYMWKIINDSVPNGLKPATDPNDFELIETWGTGSAVTPVHVGGVLQDMIWSNFRKPEIYKPNPAVGGSNGTTPEDSEWFWTNQAYYIALNYGWPEQILRVADGIGSHVMDETTINKSTVNSKFYKVSPGHSNAETIIGLTTGTTVSTFYENIVKAHVDQSLTMISAANGAELAAADVITTGDSLIVLSADSVNTSTYILDVNADGLPSDALLTSATYTIEVTGSTGTIAGFDRNTLLKTVFEGVMVPEGATLAITDENDAYMSLRKLNYDSAYVDVLATNKIYFEVIAEDGITRIVYQLQPTVNTNDAYVTSDVYSIDQFADLIQFVPVGTSASTLLENLVPATGATMVIYDKAGFERTDGNIYRDDKLLVTSADGTASKAYYFSMLNFNANLYLAYVISDAYQINQVKRIIYGPEIGSNIAEFKENLYPSLNATLQVLDSEGNESTLEAFADGDRLLVTAADGVTTTLYLIEGVTGAPTVKFESLIKMYPNPTNDRVVVQGLEKGNRVRVFNSAGIALRDVVVDNSTETVSLATQPAGIYIFVVSAGNQYLEIQKIIKK